MKRTLVWMVKDGADRWIRAVFSSAMLSCILALTGCSLASSDCVGTCERGFGLRRSGGKVVEMGQFRKGQLADAGLVQLSAESRYVGELRKGRPHGLGVLLNKDGSRWLGQFRDGLPQGNGVHELADGTTWMGRFVDGRAQGPGLRRNGPSVLAGFFQDGQVRGVRMELAAEAVFFGERKSTDSVRGLRITKDGTERVGP